MYPYVIAIILIEYNLEIFNAIQTYRNDTVKYKERKKFLRHLDELSTYIENNRRLIPNYGERWRYGESISSSFVESTINEVVTKRMVKKQQMQWSEQGAHYLLQVRTAVLNEELADKFENWYPGIKIAVKETDKMAKEFKIAA